MPPCAAFVPLPDAVTQIPWYRTLEPADYAWLALAIGLIAFELWAWWTKHRTLSQDTQTRSRLHRWFRIVGLTLWALLGFHLFF